MIHVFYFFSLFAILWEIIGVINPKRVTVFVKNMKSVGGWDGYTERQKNLSVYMLLYLLWVFLGLFTDQWVLFLTIFFLSLIPKKFVALRFVNSLLTLLVLILILINFYHLQIDFSSMVENKIQLFIAK
jgi:hypothetical protein